MDTRIYGKKLEDLNIMHLPQPCVFVAEEDVQLSQRQRIHKFHRPQIKTSSSNLYLFPENQLPEIKVDL